jgi:hypothetical protein
MYGNKHFVASLLLDSVLEKFYWNFLLKQLNKRCRAGGARRSKIKLAADFEIVGSIQEDIA